MLRSTSSTSTKYNFGPVSRSFGKGSFSDLNAATLINIRYPVISKYCFSLKAIISIEFCCQERISGYSLLEFKEFYQVAAREEILTKALIDPVKLGFAEIMQRLLPVNGIAVGSPLLGRWDYPLCSTGGGS